MIRKPLVSVFFSMMALAQAGVAQDGVGNNLAEQDRGMCRYAADHMIEIAKQSLSERSSRPERIDNRRKLVEDWVARMDSGEDPCAVYADIQKEAATF